MSALRLLTLQGEVATVAERWRRQYHTPSGWISVIGGSSVAIYDLLAALDPATATPDDVTRIVGNASWVEITCDGCHKDVDAAVEVGDDEYRTSIVCRACLATASALLPAEVSP